MRHGRAACSICGAPLSVHQVVRGGICGSVACKTALARQARERDRQAHQAALAAAAACLETFGDRIDTAAPISIGAVPCFDRPLVPADPERVAALRASLEAAIDGALAIVAETPAIAGDANDAPVPPTLGAACAVCNGRCCDRGSTHAFLTAEDLASKLARGPAASAEALLDSYMALLPERSYEGSCIYHGERGCALPRWMRADICNRFRCAELDDLADRCATATASRALIAAVKDGEVRRAVVVEGGDVIACYGEERSSAALGGIG